MTLTAPGSLQADSSAGGPVPPCPARGLVCRNCGATRLAAGSNPRIRRRGGASGSLEGRRLAMGARGWVVPVQSGPGRRGMPDHGG